MAKEPKGIKEDEETHVFPSLKAANDSKLALPAKKENDKNTTGKQVPTSSANIISILIFILATMLITNSLFLYLYIAERNNHYKILWKELEKKEGKKSPVLLRIEKLLENKGKTKYLLKMLKSTNEALTALVQKSVLIFYYEKFAFEQFTREELISLKRDISRHYKMCLYESYFLLGHVYFRFAQKAKNREEEKRFIKEARKNLLISLKLAERRQHYYSPPYYLLGRISEMEYKHKEAISWYKQGMVYKGRREYFRIKCKERLKKLK